MTLHEPPNVNAEKGPHLSKYIRYVFVDFQNAAYSYNIVH